MRRLRIVQASASLALLAAGCAGEAPRAAAPAVAPVAALPASVAPAPAVTAMPSAPAAADMAAGSEPDGARPAEGSGAGPTSRRGGDRGTFQIEPLVPFPTGPSGRRY